MVNKYRMLCRRLLEPFKISFVRGNREIAGVKKAHHKIVKNISLGCTAQKMKFLIKDLVTFMEEILNGKLHFLRSVHNVSNIVGDSASSVNYGKKGTRKHK